MDEVKRHKDFRWLGFAWNDVHSVNGKRAIPVQFLNNRMTRCGLYDPVRNCLYYHTRHMAYGRSPVKRWASVMLMDSDQAAFNVMLNRGRETDALFVSSSSSFDEGILSQFISGLLKG